MVEVDRALLAATGRERPRVAIVPAASWPDGEAVFMRWARMGEETLRGPRGHAGAHSDLTTNGGGEGGSETGMVEKMEKCFYRPKERPRAIEERPPRWPTRLDRYRIETLGAFATRGGEQRSVHLDHRAGVELPDPDKRDDAVFIGLSYRGAVAPPSCADCHGAPRWRCLRRPHAVAFYKTHLCCEAGE